MAMMQTARLVECNCDDREEGPNRDRVEIMEQKAILPRYIWKRSNAMPMLFWFPTIVMSEMCSMAWAEMLFVKQDAPMPLDRATDALSNETAPSLDGPRHS